MDRAEPGSPDSGWNRYWAGAGAAGAYAAGGVNHPAIDAFWKHFFESVPDPSKELRIVDLATGNGAMIETMIRHDICAEAITCVDLSPAAIESVEKRFPGVRGIVADTGSHTLPNGQFHLVTSQFGIEYGGESALSAAPGLVAPSGVLAMLAHATDSLISRESAANLAAIEALRASDFIVLASRLFETGFDAVRGADRTPYDAAGAALSPALRSVEAIIERFGPGVAAGTIVRLYEDVARIHQGLPHYDPDEVLTWVHAMRGEVDEYADRMRSMLNAAIDDYRFRRYCDKLVDQGFILRRADALTADEGDRLAWVLVARKTETTS
jgi:SAM-dependent methyltransferase